MNIAIYNHIIKILISQFKYGQPYLTMVEYGWTRMTMVDYG